MTPERIDAAKMLVAMSLDDPMLIPKSLAEELISAARELASAKKTIADLEQRLAESHQAHRELGELFREAKEALQKLYSNTNGCPLHKYEKGWREAVVLTKKVLGYTKAKGSDE